MTSVHRVFGSLVLCAAAALAAAQATSDAGKAIESGIKGLRAMKDSDRGPKQKDLALQIEALPGGGEKLYLAEYLASRATEGDFGKDTLQTVTDALAQAVGQNPEPRGPKGEIGGAYMELAQLKLYEDMTVNLDVADYQAALAEVGREDAQRAKADFTLTDIKGKKWTLSKLKGKIVVVNFWATWCPPCRKEMPDLQALYDQYKKQGLVILSISDEDAEKKVKPFIADHKYTYPILLDPGDVVNKRYLIEGIPKSFFYDRSGKMVAQSIDMRTKGQFLALLAKAGLHE